MTALVAMSALYPPVAEQQWDEGLGKIWQPVPYTTVPLSEDYVSLNLFQSRLKFLLLPIEYFYQISLNFLPVLRFDIIVRYTYKSFNICLVFFFLILTKYVLCLLYELLKVKSQLQATCFYGLKTAN